MHMWWACVRGPVAIRFLCVGVEQKNSYCNGTESDSIWQAVSGELAAVEQQQRRQRHSAGWHFDISEVFLFLRFRCFAPEVCITTVAFSAVCKKAAVEQGRC